MAAGNIAGLLQLSPSWSLYGATTAVLPAGTSATLFTPDRTRVLLVASASITLAGISVRIQTVGENGLVTIGFLSQFFPTLSFPYHDWGGAIQSTITVTPVGGAAQIEGGSLLWREEAVSPDTTIYEEE